jgi:alginate production protein
MRVSFPKFWASHAHPLPRRGRVQEPVAAISPSVDTAQGSAINRKIPAAPLARATACVAGLLAAGSLLAAVPASQPAGSPATLATQRTNPPDTPFREDANDAVRKEPIRINPGDKRPADQFKLDLLGRPLTIGGALESEQRYTQDRRLNPEKDDDVATLFNDFKLEFFYPWSRDVSFFIQSDYFYNPDVYTEAHHSQRELGVQLSQAWLFVHRLMESDFSLQVGRQRFADKRQWWWNELLDAGRVYYTDDVLFAELALSDDFGSKRSDQTFVDPVNDDVLRLMGDAAWQWDPKNHLALFFLSQFDYSKTQDVGEQVRQRSKDPSDGDLTWVGVRAMGKIKVLDSAKLGYWLDSAFVFGRETSLAFNDLNENLARVSGSSKKNVLAWGLDLGATWYTNWFLEPYFTVGFARGSGDSNRGDGTNTDFRQSGIQNNKVKFSGSQRIRYYGELFRPELSNLEITTAAIGFPLSETSSVDLLFHHYEQAEPSTFIRDSRIRATPNGKSGDLGNEVDLVLSLDEWKSFQVQFAGGVFQAGDAFGKLSGNTSFQLDLDIKFSF